MKKTKKTMLIAAVLTAAAAGLTGCTEESYDSSVSVIDLVYGPPEAYASEDSNDDTSADILESMAEDSSKYDPADEEIADVYGPPVDMD